MLKHSRLFPSKHLARDEGGGFGVPPPLGIICQKGLFCFFFPAGVDVWSHKSPTSGWRAGERRLGLIKRSVREIKVKKSVIKLRGRGCSRCRCQAPGRAGPALSPPSPGAWSAAAAGGARTRAAVPCQGASRQVPTAAAKAREKGGTRRRERQHLLPLRATRCIRRFGGDGDGGAAVPGGLGWGGLWQGCPKSPAELQLG